MALVAKGGSAAGVKRQATRKQSLGRARIYGCSFLLFPQLSLSHFLFLTRARPPLSVRQMVRPHFCFKTRANNRRIRDKTARRSVLWKKKKNARKRERERWVENRGTRKKREGRGIGLQERPWSSDRGHSISCRQHMSKQREKEKEKSRYRENDTIDTQHATHE